jgi:hypothetical protein
VERGQERHRRPRHDVDDLRRPVLEREHRRGERVVGMKQLQQRVVAEQHGHRALAQQTRVEGVDTRAEQRREAQHGHAEAGVTARERERVLLRLRLVAHPAKARPRIRPPPR